MTSEEQTEKERQWFVLLYNIYVTQHKTDEEKYAGREIHDGLVSDEGVDVTCPWILTEQQRQ